MSMKPRTRVPSFFLSSKTIQPGSPLELQTRLPPAGSTSHLRTRLRSTPGLKV
jgi:hypothetical protein